MAAACLQQSCSCGFDYHLDEGGAKQLLQHRPQVPVISAQELLQGGVPVEGCDDVATTTDNVLAYIFTTGTTGQSKCSVVTNRMALAEVEWYPELFSKLSYRVDRPARGRTPAGVGHLISSSCVWMMKAAYAA